MLNNTFKNLIDLKKDLPTNKKITLIGGCFDILHVGHLHLFEYAATLGELLVVAILSDDYVSKYKGINRPIINQQQRLEMVSSIKYVDYAYISDESPSSPETLTLLKPDNVVFNDSTDTEKIKLRLKNISENSPKTKVHLLPFYKNNEISTSIIIKKIKNDKE